MDYENIDRAINSLADIVAKKPETANPEMINALANLLTAKAKNNNSLKKGVMHNRYDVIYWLCALIISIAVGAVFYFH